MRCLAAKPIVHGIEKDLQGKAHVVRLNMLSKEGREIAGRYDVQGLPNLVVLDGTGKVIYRKNGIPDRKAVVTLLSS